MAEPRDEQHQDEADRRARRGQSLAHGDTGTGDPGVDPETQGISNRQGDLGEGKHDAATPDGEPERRDAEGVTPDGESGDRTTTSR